MKKKENEQAQSENPTKPPPPNRVFSLLGGFSVVMVGFVCLFLSLLPPSPNHMGLRQRRKRQRKKPIGTATTAMKTK
jgi:hypothetical protein